jgi:methyl-accepting chemotaxis protein
MSGNRSIANARKRRGTPGPPEKEVVAKSTTNNISVTQAISVLNQNITALSSKTGSFIQKLQSDIVTISEHVDAIERSNEQLSKNNEQLSKNIVHLTQMTTIQQGELQSLATKMNLLQKNVGGQLKTNNKPSSKTSNKSSSKTGTSVSSTTTSGINIGGIHITESQNNDVMDDDSATVNATPTFPVALSD